jgi:iron(III) transport system ATP-binding protein
MSVLELRSVSKSYGSVMAVDHVDLQIAAGSRTAIVGPSGSGKTTLLRLIAGFEVPEAGDIIMGGTYLAGTESFVPAHRRRIGYLPQDGALFPHLTVWENVGFGISRENPKRNDEIRELIDLVALERSMLTRWPHELSGGQQQRVALARALAQRPKLILLDEPFSALDTGLRAATRKIVAGLLASAGVTTILVTHDQAEALSFADQVAVMRGGRLIQVGSPTQVYHHPRDATTAEFLGDAIILPAEADEGWAECAIGRVQIDDASRKGGATIMLRPEQLQIVQTHDSMGCIGIVTETDFGGNSCTLTIQLAHPDNEVPLSVKIRCASIQLPPIGSTVRVAPIGSAHVLAS